MVPKAWDKEVVNAQRGERGRKQVNGGGFCWPLQWLHTSSSECQVPWGTNGTGRAGLTPQYGGEGWNKWRETFQLMLRRAGLTKMDGRAIQA